MKLITFWKTPQEILKIKPLIAVGLTATFLNLSLCNPAQAAWNYSSLSIISNGLDTFWGRFLASFGIKYQYPVVYPHNGSVMTSCGRLQLAHYCPKSNTIHINMLLMNRLAVRVGDAAPYFALAHEYGHSVQNHLGLFRRNLPIFVVELQADCLAGIFFAATNRVGILEPGDLEEGMFMAMMSGDNAYRNVNHHGTPKQRVKAFVKGFKNPRACFSR